MGRCGLVVWGGVHGSGWGEVGGRHGWSGVGSVK